MCKWGIPHQRRTLNLAHLFQGDMQPHLIFNIVSSVIQDPDSCIATDCTMPGSAESTQTPRPSICICVYAVTISTSAVACHSQASGTCVCWHTVILLLLFIFIIIIIIIIYILFDFYTVINFQQQSSGHRCPHACQIKNTVSCWSS